MIFIYVAPSLEIRVKLGTECRLDHVSEFLVVSLCQVRLLLRHECLVVSDGHIHVALDGVMNQSEFTLFSMMLQCVEDVMQGIFLIMIPKLNSSHIGLQQMSVVENVVLPSFQKLI